MCRWGWGRAGGGGETGCMGWPSGRAGLLSTLNTHRAVLAGSGLVWSDLGLSRSPLPHLPLLFPVELRAPLTPATPPPPPRPVDKGCGSGIQHRCFSALHAECRLSPPRTLAEASLRIGSILETRSEGSAASTAIHLPTLPFPSSPWPSVVPTPPRRPTGILLLVMPPLGGTSAGA